MPRPNFTGTWRFNAEKSMLQIPAPEYAVFVIEHDDPCFCLDRTHAIGGKTDTLSITLNIDGAPVVTSRDGLEIHSTLHWEDDALVFISTFPGHDDQASNTVRYRLDDAGRTLIAKERLRSSRLNYDNVWVFGRE
jgi:hypothetical protein